MKLRQLQHALEKHPSTFPRFVLPGGDSIPAHAHITEVGHVTRHFIDCGGTTGNEEKVLLQTHVGHDTDHRLRSDRFAAILRLGNRVLPNADLDVDVEYDCCVVAQYPVAEVKLEGKDLNLVLSRGRTRCRARERRRSKISDHCSASSTACC